MTDEISEINDYIFKEDIGQGNFGKVKLAIYKPTNEEFAIKIINKKMIKIKMKNVIFKENEIITKFNHINVIYVYQIIDTPENYYIIMEYCKRGELFDYIVNHQKIEEDEASVFFYQIINGVEYIHNNGIAHRDLKPENILLTQDKILKIIDFGLSHEFNEEDLLRTKCGSPSYASPEIITHPFYDGFKTDIWCCGIILFAMICGYLPFDGEDNENNNNNTLFKNIVECNLEFPDYVGELGKDLICKILTVKPEERITIPEIKKHPFYIKGKTLCKLDYSLIEENIIKKRAFKSNLGQKEITKAKGDEILDENLIAKKIFDIDIIDNSKSFNGEVNNNDNCITIVENSQNNINSNKENQIIYTENLVSQPKEKISKKINDKINYNQINKSNISRINIKITNIINFNKLNRPQINNNTNNNHILNTDTNKLNNHILSMLKFSKDYKLIDKLINTKANYTKTLEQDKLYTNNYLSTLNKEKIKFNNFKPSFRDFLKKDKNSLNLKLLGNPKNNRNIFLKKFDKHEYFLNKKIQNPDNKTFNDEIFLRNFRKNLLKKEKLNKEKHHINSNNDFQIKNNTIDIDNKSNRIISLSNEKNLLRKSLGLNDNNIKLNNIKNLLHEDINNINNVKVNIVSKEKKRKKLENLSSDKYLNFVPKDLNKNIQCDNDSENSNSFIKENKENYIIPMNKQHVYKSENNYKRKGLSLQKTYKKIDDKINLSKLIQNLNQESEYKKSSVKKKNKSFFNRLNINHKTIESYSISNRNNTIENNRIPVNLTKKMRNYNFEIKFNEIKNINGNVGGDKFNKNRNLIKIKDNGIFKTSKNNILPILTENNRNIRLLNFKKV